MRIYWQYIHWTLRYEELQHLLAAGLEVIPQKPSKSSLRVPQGYEDSLAAGYVNWEKQCSLPLNLVEQIRQIDLGRPDTVTEEQWSILNTHVDVLMSQVPPSALLEIARKFKGLILYRFFGFVDKNFTQQCAAVGVKPEDFPLHVRFSHNLPMLLENEASRFIDSHIYIPATISEERLGGKWSVEKSNPELSCIISYLDNPLMKGVLDSFSSIFEDFPTKILGKNRTLWREKDLRVTGEMQWHDLMRTIQSSRIHIETGMFKKHLRFSPMEASLSGVPVLFLEDSGLAEVLRLSGYDRDALVDMGMCSNIFSMKTRVSSIFENFDELSLLAKKLSWAVKECFSECQVRQGIDSMIKESGTTPSWPQGNRLDYLVSPPLSKRWPTQIGQIQEMKISDLGIRVIERKGVSVMQSGSIKLVENLEGSQIIARQTYSVNAVLNTSIRVFVDGQKQLTTSTRNIAAALVNWTADGPEVLKPYIIESDRTAHFEIPEAANTLELRLIWSGKGNWLVKQVMFKGV